MVGRLSSWASPCAHELADALIRPRKSRLLRVAALASFVQLAYLGRRFGDFAQLATS